MTANDKNGCQVCETRGRPLYSGRPDAQAIASGVWDILQCPACRLLWLEPRPDDADLRLFYDDYFTHDYPVEATHPVKEWLVGQILCARLGYAANSKAITARAGRWLLKFVPLLPELACFRVMNVPCSLGGRLLDVGCGNGVFLKRMANLGWTVEGVEPDTKAAMIAADYVGCRIHAGTLADAALPERSFDVLTLNHVIEHVPDPVGLLRECRRVLRSGGSLFIVTPNGESLGHRFFKASWYGLEVPRHLQMFSPYSLRLVLEREAFEPLAFRTTAREARLMWWRSATLAGTGRLARRSAKPRFHRRVPGYLFQLSEHILISLGCPWVGEELWVRAEPRDEAQEDVGSLKAAG